LTVKGNPPSLYRTGAGAFASAHAEAFKAVGQHPSAMDAEHGRFVLHQGGVAENDGRVDPLEWAACRTLGWVKTTRFENETLGETE